MVSGRMMMIRACPSLLIAAVMKDPYFNAGCLQDVRRG
jgi:hypothetical protein